MDRQLESGSESFAISEQPSLNFSTDVKAWNSISDAREHSFTTAQDTVDKEFGTLIIDRHASAEGGGGPEASSGPDQSGENSRPNSPPSDRAEENDLPAGGGGLEASSGPDQPGVNSRPNNPPSDRAEENERPAPTGGREAESPDIPGPRPSLPIEDGVPAPQPGRYIPADVPAIPMPGREGDGTSPIPRPELPVEEPGRHKPWDLPPDPMPGADGISPVRRPMGPIPGWRRGIANQHTHFR